MAGLYNSFVKKKLTFQLNSIFPHSFALPLSSMDKLWVLAILTFLLVIGGVYALPPNDLWWHARVGSEILNSGQIPRQDAYSLTERGQPFYYQSWLAEVLLAGTLRIGGVRLLVLIRALIMTGLFATVMLLAWVASGGNRRAVIPVTLAAILIGLGNMTVRPQLFAYPLFIAAFALLWSYRRGGATRAIWLVPLLMVIWVNMHGSFVLGLGLVWLVLLGELLSYLLPMLAGEQMSDRADARKRLKTLFLVALLSIAVLLLNPRGLGIVGYVNDLLTDVPSQSLGAEWQPPDPQSGLGISFFVLLLMGVATLALARPAIALTELLLVLAFAWLAASGVRYVVWFGLVSAPIMAAAVVRLPSEDLARWRDRFAANTLGQRLLYGDGTGYPGFRRLTVMGAIISLLVVVGLLLLYPDDDLWLTPVTGTDAVALMEQNGLQGRLFNELGRGSYVIWRLGPSQPVFIDPRFELYSLEHFQDYLKLSKAEEAAAGLLAEYDFDLLLLDRGSQEPLAELVDGQPQVWRQMYEDDHTLLYRRVEE
jgi:hypothetical protein